MISRWAKQGRDKIRGRTSGVRPSGHELVAGACNALKLPTYKFEIHLGEAA